MKSNLLKEILISPFFNKYLFSVAYEKSLLHPSQLSSFKAGFAFSAVLESDTGKLIASSSSGRSARLIRPAPGVRHGWGSPEGRSIAVAITSRNNHFQRVQFSDLGRTRRVPVLSSSLILKRARHPIPVITQPHNWNFPVVEFQFQNCHFKKSLMGCHMSGWQPLPANNFV